MGLLSYLQRTLASYVRPWILQKDLLEPMLLHLRFGQIVLELQSPELDCGTINSLLTSSPYILRHARLEHAKLTISFFRSPGVFFEIGGLHFAGDIRPAEDSFWSHKQKQKAEDLKREAILALDPEGASVHAAAERHAKEADRGFLKSFFMSVFWKALRIELHDASASCHLDAMDGCTHIYFLHLERLELEEQNGLAGAAIRKLVNTPRQADQTFCKFCSVEKFGLRLETCKEEIQLVQKAYARYGSEGHSDYEWISKGYVLLWKNLSLILQFETDHVTGVDAFATETMLEVSLAEMEAFVSDASQLQGLSRQKRAAHEMSSGRKPLSHSRYLWLRAFEKITSGTWKNFKDAVEAGMLRQRYAQIYASWILRAGEGLFAELNGLSFKKGFRREKLDLKSLEWDLSILERDLSVEAIVLARSVARHRVLEATHEHGMPARPHGLLVLSMVVSGLLVILGALQKNGIYLITILKEFFRLIFNSMNQILTSIGIYWLYLRCLDGMAAMKNKFSGSSTHLASQSSEEDSEAMAGFLERIQERRLPRIKSMRGHANFTSTFHAGSLTLIGSLDHVTVDNVRKGLKRSFPPLTGVQLSWGNASMAYVSSANVVGLNLVIGFIQAAMVTFSVSYSENDGGMNNADGQRLMLSGKSGDAKFLQSCPAPEACIPERVQDYLESGDISGEGVSPFMDFLEKGKALATFAESIDNDHSQPFLSFSSEKTQTNFIIPEKHSDISMCCLAVGCLDCNLDLKIFMQLGLLLAHVVDVLSAKEDRCVDEVPQTTLSTNISRSPGLDWQILYTDKLKQFISNIVIKKKTWLLTAVDCPKVQCLGFSADSKESNKDVGGALDNESVLVICLGHIEAIVWPAKVDQDDSNLEKLDDMNTLSSSEMKKQKVWVRPPSPQIQGEKVIENSSRYEQVGSNGLLSVQGAVLVLQAVNGVKQFSLAGPLKMNWEFSLCRSHFLSPFGVCDIMSAAALGTFSAITSGILMDDIRMMSKVLTSITTAYKQFSDLKGFKGSDNQQMYLQKDSRTVPSTNSKSSHSQPLFFAVMVEIHVNKVDCFVMEKSESDKASHEIANQRRFCITDRFHLCKIQEERFNWLDCFGDYGNSDHFLVKEFCFKFSWGDGRELLASSGFEEVSLSIAKIESGASMENIKQRSPISDWKSRGSVASIANEHRESAKMRCHAVIQQCHMKVQRPWCFPDTLDDVVTQETVLGFGLKKLQLTDGASESLVNKALSRTTSAAGFFMDITMSESLENISVISKGGMLVLHAQASLLLLQEWQTLLSLGASSKPKTLESVSQSDTLCNGSQESSTIPPPSFGKSSSLPLQYTQMKQLKHRRLYSAPMDFSTAEEDPVSIDTSQLLRSFSLEVLGLKLLLAQTSSMFTEPQGFLIELGAVSKLQRTVKKQTMSFETNKLSLCSLQPSQGQYTRRGKGQGSQLPRFGSMLSQAAESGNTEDIRESLRTLSDSSQIANEGITMAKSTRLLSRNTSSRTEEGPTKEKMNDFILENFSITLDVENSSVYSTQSESSDGWRGSCSFLDIDVGITTSEIQLLLALLSSLSGLSFSPKSETVKKSRDPHLATHIEQVSDHIFEVPDGSIVTLKDAHEHLYMAVDVADKKNRLIGVLHHSLAGDKALFKVKYQKKSRDSVSWFSLSSIAATNADGEHFRVHYRPGSGLADISSVHDGSWELWQALPYKYSAREDDGDIDLYNDLNSSLVHLINQKGKQGLTLASGSPMMVKKPGNPFKIKVMRSASVIDNTFAQLELRASINSALESKDSRTTTLAEPPKIEMNVGKVNFTLLFETGGGKHLLPLLRGRLEDVGAVMHMHADKFRLIGDCKFVFEYLEAHVDKWSAIVQPVDIGLFYRSRTRLQAKNERAKLRTSFFTRCKKMDFAISETSLDMILFVIGILNFAGPYTIKHSPVLATSCVVENHTGLDLCCHFDTKGQKEVLKIPAWKTETFFVRNMVSRRDLWPANVLSSVSFSLEKENIGWSSPVHTSLTEPSIIAVRTRLERKNGHKKSSGPIIVVDVPKKTEDGIIVTVSPMIRIHNASGLSLELRCRRPKGEGEGAIVMLKDGDKVDDSMGAFDALTLEGEQKKALSSFNLGDYLLSVRPISPSASSAKEGNRVTEFDWSEDIKGAKPVRISGFFDKLQYGLRKSLKGRNTSASFGTVVCETKSNEGEYSDPESSQGKHFLIRSTCRYVPLSTSNPNAKHEAKNSVVAWQEQKELVLLPTLRIYNFLDSKISVTYCTASKGIADRQLAQKLHVEQASPVFMYADLSDLAFSVEIDKLMVTSKYVSIGEWSKNFERSNASTPADHLKELEMELDFGDDIEYAKLKLFRADDGVLQVLVYTHYALKNKSDVVLSCCVPKQSRYFWAPWKKGTKMEWPPGEDGVVLQPGATVSLLTRSSLLLLRMGDKLSETSSLDLDSFSGSTELSLNISHENGTAEQVQLGLRMEMTEAGNFDPTRTIRIGSRYIASNRSPEAIFICQDGFQEDENATFLLKAGEHVSLRTRHLPGHQTNILGQSKLVEPDLTDASTCSVRFRLQENGWDWTGPVCASALGSFSIRIHRSSEGPPNAQTYSDLDNKAKYKFVAVDIEEDSPSLVVRFRLQSPDTVPYRIENSLSQSSVFFYQKGLDDTVTTLDPGQAIGYAWDDLSKPHKLVLSVSGTQICSEVKLDKLNPWRSFRAVRLKKGFGLQLPFVDQSDGTSNDSTDASGNVDPSNVGYEISADGSQRVLRVCENVKSSKLKQWQSHISFPSARIEFRIPIFGITLFENIRQRNIPASGESSENLHSLSPIIGMRASSLFMEILNTQKHILIQLKVQTLNIDEKWQGAPFAAAVRVHSEDRFKKGETVLHMAAIVSNQVFDPIHVKYSSVLLQAIDVNLDEETLMKLVPFYRYSLAESTSSRQFYFERLEIHPIKIVASFLPGQPLADYSSAQETFRALLHSFIKVPSIRGSNVELNGVLLSHALLTFRQLAIKCAQHYSWYAMRAVYIAKGSKLLPPAFASIFDDSAASSLDVFFDPSIGSVDLQGLTLGMFNLLSEGLNRRGFSGTSRYIGDLERTMKTAGSNILFAVMTEVSDNVLKGAETGGLEGMVNGFRRGILNVSMEPSLLRTAIVKGGSSRRIKLDHSAGIDETYVEGYLQAMLDTAFKQDYLKVKVVDDQVLLKNLPPSSVLIDEIMESVRAFLIREGLLVGETSASAIHSLRRLQGDNDKRIVPAVVALCEQIFVIFAVRALRNQTRSWFHWSGPASSVFWGRHTKEEKNENAQPEPEGGQENRRGIKGIMLSFVLSSAMAYIDGRLCRHIPNTLARRVVSGFLLSFVE